MSANNIDYKRSPMPKIKADKTIYQLSKSKWVDEKVRENC